MAIYTGETPSAVLADYLNPYGRTIDFDTLLAAIDARHSKPIEVADMGTLVGRAQVPFIMARLGIISVETKENAARLGLSDDFVGESIAAADKVSRSVVETNLARLDDMLVARSDIGELLDNKAARRLFAAANIAAEYAHAGQFRQTPKRLPYIFHICAVQAIPTIAARSIRADFCIEPELIDELCIINAVGASHDGTEKVLKPDLYWRLATTDILPPPDLGKLAIRLGLQAQIANELPADLLGLIVLPGLKPEGFDEAKWYQDSYIGRMTPRAKVVKIGDMFDNMHNPKQSDTPEGKDRTKFKAAIYEKGITTMPSLLREPTIPWQLAKAIGQIDPRVPREFFGDRERTTANDISTLLEYALAS